MQRTVSLGFFTVCRPHVYEYALLSSIKELSARQTLFACCERENATVLAQLLLQTFASYDSLTLAVEMFRVPMPAKGKDRRSNDFTSANHAADHHPMLGTKGVIVNAHILLTRKPFGAHLEVQNIGRWH
jgi:hypothetical protein